MEVDYGLSGLLVGLAGLGYAFYENRARARLTTYVRAQNWHLYNKANNASGAVQRALKKFKESNESFTGGNAETLEWLSKSDAFCQDVFKDAVRQIHVAEPKFKATDIERWVDEKRITVQHAQLFYALAAADRANPRASQSAIGEAP